MGATDAFPEGAPPVGATPGQPGGLMDVLGVAAVMLDADGRITLWSPQAEQLFGWSAEEALGRPAAQLLVGPEHFDLVLSLFSEVMAGGESWAGVFPVRHKDGSTRLVEFRNMRLLDERGESYALGIATDQAVLRRVERDLALSVRLVAQSPIGLAVLDTDLRYVMVNPALERINGLPADQHIGRDVGEALPFLDTGTIVSSDARGPRHRDTAARPVHRRPHRLRPRRRTGPGRCRTTGWRTPAAGCWGWPRPSWTSPSSYRAATEAARARRRLAVIADASAPSAPPSTWTRPPMNWPTSSSPSWPTWLRSTSWTPCCDGRRPTSLSRGGPGPLPCPRRGHRLPHRGRPRRRPPGQIANYEADRLITRCVTEARPVLHRPRGPGRPVAHRRGPAGRRPPRQGRTALLPGRPADRPRRGARRAGPHPRPQPAAVRRGRRRRSPANWPPAPRSASTTPAVPSAAQRRPHPPAHLLPRRPPQPPGLEIAYRYQPAEATSEVGGDWFDVIPLAGDKTALVVGDVMGSGINAAATMGQLRTATSHPRRPRPRPRPTCCATSTRSPPDLDAAIATCVYAVYDPHRAACRIAVAGHLPPVLIRPGRPPELLDLPTGAPLGVGGVPFEPTTSPAPRRPAGALHRRAGRDPGPAHRRPPGLLLELLAEPEPDLEDTLRPAPRRAARPDDHDDVALLIARVHAHED